MPHLDRLRERLSELQAAREQCRALHNTFFDLHLAEEIMQTHKIMHDLDIRIEQIELLVHKHSTED